MKPDELAALMADAESSTAGVGVTPLRALQYVTVWSCVRLLAESIAQLPVHVFTRKSDGSKQRVTDATLSELLSSRPNSWQTGFEYFEYLVTALCMRGNHYCYANRIGSGANRRIAELIPFQPGSVTVKRDGYDLTYDVRRQGGGVDTYSAEKIHHVRGLTLDGFIGVSPIEFQRESIGLAMAAEKHGGLTFKNGARPSGILSFLGKLSDDAYERILKSWVKNYSGENIGKTAVLEEGGKYESISMSNTDAQYLEVRGYQRTEICSIFRVPPHMIGDLTRSSFSNITQQSLEFAKFTILPWCRRIESAISRDLFTEAERKHGMFVEFLVAGLERADLEQRMRSYNIGIMSGIWSPNECRKKENMNPRPGGDIYLAPLNMTDSTGGMPKSPDKGAGIRSIAEGVGDLTTKATDGHRMTKGAREREALRNQFAPRFKVLAEGLVGYEVGEVRQLVKGEQLTPVELSGQLVEFYAGMPEIIRQRFLRLSREYAVAVRRLALAEIDSDHEISPDELAAYVDGMVDAMGARYTGSSSGQLMALIAETAGDDLQEVIGTRLEEWHERRPAKVADRESVQQESVLSRWVWAAAGVTYLQWNRRGSKSCPFCVELDGKVVGIDAPFVEKGNYEPAGHEQSPWKIRGPKMHAPLHQGCQCIIAPVVG